MNPLTVQGKQIIIPLNTLGTLSILSEGGYYNVNVLNVSFLLISTEPLSYTNSTICTVRIPKVTITLDGVPSTYKDKIEDYIQDYYRSLSPFPKTTSL